MQKLALAMIVKPSDDEAVLLERCLSIVSQYVDGIFLTITGENEMCEAVAKKYHAKVSHFVWKNNFSHARNFNFSQVSKDFDYILWLDCDDVVDSPEKFKEIIQNNTNTDVFILDYVYEVDEWGNPIVVHKKTRIVKNDGCVSWSGSRLHEDFSTNRGISAKLCEDFAIIHKPTKKHLQESAERNIKISEEEFKEKPNDPRSYWNLASSYILGGRLEESIATFEEFFKRSSSDEEKYIAHMRVAECYVRLNNFEKALEHARQAIGMRPAYPDAYTVAGQILFSMDRLAESAEILKYSLSLTPNLNKIIVYNPRDYDLVPMKLLAKVYFSMNLPQLALPLLEGCLKIAPKDKDLETITTLMRKEADKVDEVVKKCEELSQITDNDVLLEELNKIPEEFQQHPLICRIRNTKFIKKESSGKDIVFFCGATHEDWTPETAITKGIGGSEEAVINLSREFVKLGYNVTVYNSCGHKERMFDGVKYKPYWTWNYRDKQDVTIFWRSAKLCDYDINSSKIFIDLHDVIPKEEFTPQRLQKITGIFVKSEMHKGLFNADAQEKMHIVQNGIDTKIFFADDEKRDEMLIVNTSSPDRSLSACIKIFEKVKKEIPSAKFAWAYGWNVFDAVHSSDKLKMEWKNKIMEDMERTGAMVLGRLGHGDIARLYKKASVFLYPTEFSEIDCISARKAQAAGAYPVTTNFAALKETVKFGDKFEVPEYEHTSVYKDFDFGVENEELLDKMANSVISALKNKKNTLDNRKEMKSFDWSEIAKKWSSIIA